MKESAKGRFFENSVSLRKNPIIFRTYIMVFTTDPVLIRTESVIFKANFVILSTKSDIF